MPNSLRSKIKHLAYKGEFNEREMDRLLSALDHEIDVTYICDGKKCPECSKLCNHTTDISHAINFEPVMFIDEKTVTTYEEKMPRYKPPKTRWIPVSERLPKDHENVLIYLSSNQITIGLYNSHKLPFRDEPMGWGVDAQISVHNFCSDDVIAWMPLPQPYKEESEDKE